MEGLTCLQCGQPLDQDFGIVACTNCGAVLMIDMDGQVQLADKSEDPPESPESVAPEADFLSAPEADLPPQPESDSLIEETQEPGSSFEPFAAEPEESLQAETEEPLSEPEPSLDGEGEVAVEPMASFESPTETLGSEEPTSEEPALEEPAPADENGNWFDQGLDAPPPEPEAAPVAANDFSDVSEFGNQDVDMGALHFELTLSGIDHKDLRAEVMEVLSDPRLYLNLKDHPIRSGTITLPGLNAARTSLIVTRLQHLNLQIHWKQKAYEA